MHSRGAARRIRRRFLLLSVGPFLLLLGREVRELQLFVETVEDARGGSLSKLYNHSLKESGLYLVNFDKGSCCSPISVLILNFHWIL